MQNTPLPVVDCHPKMDESPLLDTEGVRQFQILIGMAQWAVTIRRINLAHAILSLSRFYTAPRQGHLELAMRVFGYVKKFPERRLEVNSRALTNDPPFPPFEADFWDDYPDASEEIDPNLPKPLGEELQSTVFSDADHTHDLKTHHSITGLIVWVGLTPIHWLIKRNVRSRVL